jgi:uncharacterized protein YbjT (DUF2867 family)
MAQNTKQILITGGNGKTGRRIAARLTQLNIPIRIGSRNGDPAFDWYDESTWKKALENIHAVYISFQPDLAVPDSAKIMTSFMTASLKAGVTKLVLLSGRGEPEAETAEQIIINSGIGYTVLRASWFNQNFSENYLLDPIRAGEVQMPTGNVPEPFIDAEDIADAAVEAFTNKSHANKLYEITGPELLTFKNAVEIISGEIGRPVQFTDLTIAEYVQQLRQYQLPQDYIDLITYLYSEVMDGRNSSVTSDLEKVLGRKPRDFRTYVRESKEVW